MVNAVSIDVSSSTAPAVDRALLILQSISRSPSGRMSLSELARECAAPKSSVLNVCAALVAGRVLQRTDGGYGLDVGVLDLGAAYFRTHTPVEQFLRACERSPVLRDQTVQLARLDGSDIVYLARHQGTAPFRMMTDVGSRLAAHTTALGKAMLSTLPPDALEGIPISSSELELTRSRGFATESGEAFEGFACVASAFGSFRDEAGPFGVSVTMTEGAFERSDVARLAAALGHLGAELGQTPQPSFPAQQDRTPERNRE
jgi:DNA-binding IclR family transcriptional regulator